MKHFEGNTVKDLEKAKFGHVGAEVKKKPPVKKELKPVDWDQVAIEIRAGILTDRQIGAKHGRSHTAIQKWADKNGIERNLTTRIRQRAEMKVAKALVAKQGCQESGNLTQEQTIDLASEVSATIVIKQQGRIGRHLKVATALLDELESQTIDRALYENLGELMAVPDKNGLDRLNELYRKVISTPSRIDSHKKAIETEKSLIAMERQAFSIDDAPPASGSTFEANLDAIA